MAAQTEDAELAEHFAAFAKSVSDNEDAIVTELAEAQGNSVDIGGYYPPDPDKLTSVMRPSKTFNEVLTTWPSHLAMGRPDRHRVATHPQRL